MNELHSKIIDMVLKISGTERLERIYSFVKYIYIHAGKGKAA